MLEIKNLPDSRVVLPASANVCKGPLIVRHTDQTERDSNRTGQHTHYRAVTASNRTEQHTHVRAVTDSDRTEQHTYGRAVTAVQSREATRSRVSRQARNAVNSGESRHTHLALGNRPNRSEYNTSWQRICDTTT